mmetsp:Transcript_52856/g.129061  ORF Transcript_52856/g.129061 Transcript_52856/m.129061 type:complete len:204 (+) Transcript_52856:240-851(+)
MKPPSSENRAPLTTTLKTLPFLGTIRAAPSSRTSSNVPRVSFETMPSKPTREGHLPLTTFSTAPLSSALLMTFARLDRLPATVAFCVAASLSMCFSQRSLRGSSPPYSSSPPFSDSFWPAPAFRAPRRGAACLLVRFQDCFEDPSLPPRTSTLLSTFDAYTLELTDPASSFTIVFRGTCLPCCPSPSRAAPLRPDSSSRGRCS